MNSRRNQTEINKDKDFTCFLNEYKYFSPKHLRQILKKNITEGNQIQPQCHTVFAAILFADIAGFTRIASQLKAEDLKKHINDYFSLLLGIVKDNYGDVVKFCGDALIIFWPVSVDADENVRSAAVLMSSICALDLIKMCGKYTQSAYTADGTPFSVELALHCGISCGTTHCMILGDAERYEYLLSGEAISYAGKAEGCANSGEVCIHIDAANLVKGKLDVGITEKDDQILQLTGKISTNYPQKPLKDNENFTISEHVEFMIDTNRWNGRNKFYGKESHQNNQQNTLKNTNSFDEYQLKKDSNISNINNRLSSVSMYGKIQYRKSCNYTNGIWQYFNNSIDLSLNTSRSKLAVDVLSTSQISNSIDTSCTIACDKTESNLMVNNKELTLRQLKLKLDYFSDRSIQEVKSYLSQWNYKWDKVKRWTIDSSLESFPSQVENKRLKLSRDLRKFVHETARSAIETHTSALLSEMRDISTVFINIIGLEESFRTGQWNRPQQALKLVLSGLIKYGGSLRQFVVDDKGVVAIGVFGLYGSSSSNNSVQSIKASYYITEEFKKINLLARIGITQGMVYCGLVGSGLRCEFTVIGTSVNLSARLMCASEELSSSVILVSDVVQRSTAKIFKFNELEKITAKGYNEPVSVYSPKKDESFILGRRYSYGEICNNRSNSSKTYQYLERENVDQLIHLYLKIRNNNYQERQNYIQTINKNSFDWNDPILVLRGSEGFGKTSCLNRIESLLNHAYDSETVVTNTILKVTGLSSSYLEDFYLIRKIFLEQNRQIYGETGSTSMYFLCKQLVKYYFVDGYCLSQAIYDYRNSFLHDLLKDTNGIPSELNCCTKGIIQHDNTELQKSNSEILCFNQLPNTIIFTREFRPLNSCDVCSLTLENSCEIFSNAAIQADLFGGVEKLKSMILEIILSASLGKVKQKTKTLKVFNLLIDDLDKCDTSSLEVLMKLRDLDITVESSGDMQDFCMSGCIIVTGKPLLECSNQDQIFLSQILYRNYIELKGLSDFAIKTLMKQALGESRWKWLTTFPTGKKATIIRRRSMNFIETSTKFCCSIEENVNQSESSQEISFLNDCRAQTAGSPGLLLHLARILVELLDSHCYQWREKLDLKCFSKHSNVVDCVTERHQIFEVLDHLGGTEMAVLKAASVIGESFCTSLLSQLLESMGLKSCSIVIDDLLQFLVNFGIVSKSKDLIYSFFDIEKTNASNVYSFKCSRTRNVVYNLLLDSQRKQAHSFIAQYYERKLDYDSSLVHFLLSDNLSKKIYYLQLAAKKAENLKEYDKSLEFWSQLFLLSFGMSLHEFHSFCLYEEHKMILTMQSKWIDIQKHFQRSEQEKNLNEVEFKQRNRKWWKLKVFDNRIVSMDYDCKPRAPPSAIINAKTVIDVNVKRLVQQDKLLLCGNYKEFICRIHSVDKAFEKSINSCLVKKIDEVLSFCTLYAKRKSIEGILKQAIESDDSFDSNIFDSDYLYLKEAPSSVGIKRKDVLGWFQSVAQVFERQGNVQKSMDFNAIAIATTDLKSGEYRNETKETQETIFSNSFSDNYNDFGVWIRSIFNKEISQTGVNSIIKSIDTAKRNKGIDTEHNKCTYTSRYQANSHRSTTSLNSVQIFDQSYSLREQQCDEITTKPVDIDSTSHPFISKDRSPGQKNFRNVLEGKVMMTECDRLYQSCSHIHISDEGVQHLTTTTKSKVNVAIFLIVQGNVGVSKGILEEAYYMVREYKNVLTKRKEGYLKNRQRKIRRTLVSVEEIEYLVTIWLSCCYALQRQFGQASLTLFHVKEESFDVNCRTRIDYKLSKCLILSKYGYFREALSCLDTIRNDTVLTKGTVCEYVIKSILPWLLLATGKIENAVEYSIVSDFVDCDTNRNIKRKIVESMQFVSYLSRKLMVNTDTTKILDQSMREDVDSQSILGSCIHEDIYKERVDIFFAAVNSVDQNQPKFTIFQSHVVLIFLRDLLQQDIGGCNPLEIPVTSEEFEMAKLYLNIKFKGEKIAVNISNVDQIPTDTFSLSDIILLYTTIYSSIFVLKDFFQTFSHDLEIRKNDKQKSSSIQKKANNQIKYIENEACAIELLLLTVISAFRLIREIQYSNNEILLASIVQIEMELLRNAIYNFGYPYDVITMNIDKFYLHKINNFRLKRKSTKLKVYPFHHLKPDETFSIDDIRKFKNNLEEFSKNDAFYANNSSREEISAFIAKMDQNLCWQVASIVSDNPNTSVVESNEVLEKDARSWPQTFFEHIRRIQCEKLSSIIEEMETTNAVRDEREYFRRISVKKK